jgi:hypothetical protein
MLSRAALGQRRQTLQGAARQGDVEALKQFIANGADLNEVDRGYTPLTAAVESTRIESIRTLLEGGANPNAKDGRGSTALHDAATRGQAEAIDLLLAKGADVKAADDLGQTPLHRASATNHSDIVEKLLTAGADVNAEDKMRRTPLSVARSRRQNDVAALLEERGGTVPAVQMYGPGYDESMMYSPPGASGAAGAPGAYGAPAARRDLLADPNLVQEALETVAAMGPFLKASDANSATEQRSWAQRRMDNRTSLIRAVQKQFLEELAFVRKTAQAEEAENTVKAVDELVTKRTERYQTIGDELRTQRREMMRSQQGDMRGRGRRGGRGGYMQDASMGGYTDNAYTMVQQPGTTRDPNAPPLPPETEAQLQAWLSTSPEDKLSLLDIAHQLDLAELGALYEVAEEEEARKSGATILAIMMSRQMRVEKIVQKIQADEARMQRLQERQEMQGGYRSRGRGGYQQQGTQNTGSRTGRRYR